MPSELVMPRLSDTMEEGTVLKWLKQEGDQITKGEPILEVATDKANMELEAFDDGVLDKIVVQEGQTVPIGEPIAIIRKAGEAPSGDGKPVAAAKAAHPSAPPEPEEEAAAEPEAETSATARPAEVEPPPAEEAEPARAEGERIKASPLARRLAEEHDVDITRIMGTGPGGRVIREDVEAFVAKGAPAEAKPRAEVTVPTAAAAQELVRKPEPGEAVPLTRMQETIVKRMVESKTTIPHFYVTVEIDMTETVRFRREANESARAFEAQEISFNDIVVKAAALALRRFPEVNASYREGKIVFNGDVNVGVAVALPDGLVVPVIHGADKKSLRQIATDAKETFERARTGRLRPDDYVGGTFSVSNLGMFDVDEFSAIISPPQSGILAVGSVKPKPVVVDGQIKISDRMRVTLSADHRVYYGATAAQFLKELKRLLESPLELVL